MSAETTIKLRTPLTIGDQTIDAITLSVPSLKDISEIGDPFEVIPFDWGGHYVHTHLERLNHLVRRCITAPADVDAWLDQVGLVDGLEIVDTKAASVLNSITDAITRLSKAAGDDPKTANAIGDAGIAGGGLLTLLLGRKLLRSGYRFLMDRPRVAAPAGAVAEGGMLGTALSWIGPALALASLKGDTPDNPNWMRNWKAPAGWDYTLGAGGGFSTAPGSYTGSTFSGGARPAWVASGIPDFGSGGAAFAAVPTAPPAAEVNGDVKIGVQIEPSDSFISRIVQAVRMEINGLSRPGSGAVGTAGSTGLSMPEAGPQP
jgi:hypothetical protein